MLVGEGLLLTSVLSSLIWVGLCCGDWRTAHQPAVWSEVDNRNTSGSPTHCPTLLSISFTLDFLPQLLMKVLWRTYTILIPCSYSRCWIQRGEKKRLRISVDCKTCLTVFKISFASHKATRFCFWFPPNPNLFMEKVLISDYPVRLTDQSLFLKTELCSRLNSPHPHPSHEVPSP